MEYGNVFYKVPCDRSLLSRSGSSHRGRSSRSLVKTTVVFTLVALACIFLNASDYPTQLVLRSYSFSWNNGESKRMPCSPSSPHLDQVKDENILENTLRRAAMKDHKTVIITTLNAAWTKPGSIFDLFLQSFRIGNQTQNLLQHLLVVALDQKAYSRCMEVADIHCFKLTGVNFSEQAYFMSPDYLKMMWRRIDFLHSVLEMGYDFIFTDADVMWLRNPFPRFHSEGDFQIACDFYKFNSTDLNNLPNGGFTYVKSNSRTIQFYKFWYNARDYFPRKHDQDVFNLIKFNPFIARTGLQIRFLNTAHFGGFCQPSKDLDLVVTMHANCCIVLENKIRDIKMVLEDWKKYKASANKGYKDMNIRSWSGPWRCGMKRNRQLRG